MSDLAKLDATAQAQLVRDGQASPAELVDAAIERLERLNPQLNAVVHPALELARERARSGELQDGPLKGVPFLMKNIGSPEAGRPNTAGMAALKAADYREPANGHFTEKLLAAGTVSLGRTNTPELALLPTTEPEAYGATCNPWSLEHSSGGSSGGSSAAVAAGIVPAAHASDGGGSIRGPASMCGLYGLKPTRARNSFGPGVGERWSGLSAEFVLTRSVRDSALLLDLLSGPMPGDPYFAAPPAESFVKALDREPPVLRVGVMRSPREGLELDPDCLAAVDRTAEALEELGHLVEEAHPAALDDPSHVGTYVNIVACNTARALDAAGEKLGRSLGEQDVEPLTWALAQMGRAMSAPAWLAVTENLHGFGRQMARFWSDQGFHILLSPTQALPPPKLGHIHSTRQEPLLGFLRSAPYGCFTLPFNMSGQPAASLPTHLTPEGLPVGVQLVGPYGDEALLLCLSRQLERARPWAERRPPLFG